MNALELADILENKIPSIECLEVVAAELRRLHAINAELVEALEKTLDYVSFSFSKGLIGADDLGLEIEDLLEKAKQ